MLRVHLSDGRTLRFNLEDESEAERWRDSVADAKFQSSITGITTQHNGVGYSLSRPDGYSDIFMFAEHLPEDVPQKFKGGQRMICQADNARLVVMVHDAQRSARVSLSKPGVMRYNPLDRRP